VVELERPKRRHLGPNGESDPIDAEAAAGAVVAGEAVGEPKRAQTGADVIGVSRSAGRSALKTRSRAADQLEGLRLTAPDELLDRLRGHCTKELVRVAARLRLADDPDDVVSRPPGSRSVGWPAVTRPTLRRSRR
jgi:transposase